VSNLSREELLAMKAAGNDWVNDARGMWHWPFCIVAGCHRRSCLSLKSERCYPHTLPGVPLANDEIKQPEAVT